MTYQSGIDAVVINYRTPSDLKTFLQAWGYYVDVENTLYVANVAPTEDDIRAADDPVVDVYLSFAENVGYAKACNAAARYGQREVIAFFNADTRITDSLLSLCHQALMSVPERGVLGPRQVNDRNKLTHAGILGTPEAPRHRGWLAGDNSQFSDVRDDAVTVSGSAFFIKRSVWDELTTCPTYQSLYPEAKGAFLPTTFYYEETWAAYHARAHGYLCTYFGLVRMIHNWHNSVKTNDAERWANAQMKTSRAMFREACDAHSIGHD